MPACTACNPNNISSCHVISNCLHLTCFSLRSGATQIVIDDSKFAPKRVIDSDFPDDSECPICFLNYEALNESLCCKQLICTECYLLMKRTAIQAVAKCPCPYCSTEVLYIMYRPKTAASKAASSSSSMKILSSSAPTTSFLEDSNIASNGSSFSSPSNSSYSKTDGYETTSSSGESCLRACMRQVQHDVNVPKSSIKDRNHIEDEIQRQRNRYSDDQPPPRPPSGRTRASDVYMESLTNSFARRSYSANRDNSDFLNSGSGSGSRGVISDFEHASLRLRFAVAIGDRNSERLSQRLLIPGTVRYTAVCYQYSTVQYREIRFVL